MRLRTGTVLLVMASQVGCWFSRAVGAPAAEVCPTRHGPATRFMVFDGPPEELASLVPEVTDERSGFWPLAYVYEAGRFVTVRCEYGDGQALDVRLSNKVSQCDYKTDAAERYKLYCK